MNVAFVAPGRHSFADEACMGRISAGRCDVTPVSLSWLLRTALLRQLRSGDTLRGVVAQINQRIKLHVPKECGSRVDPKITRGAFQSGTCGRFRL